MSGSVLEFYSPVGLIRNNNSTETLLMKKKYSAGTRYMVPGNVMDFVWPGTCDSKEIVVD